MFGFRKLRRFKRQKRASIIVACFFSLILILMTVIASTLRLSFSQAQFLGISADYAILIFAIPVAIVLVVSLYNNFAVDVDRYNPTTENE